jgi:hypothetical protein
MRRNILGRGVEKRLWDQGRNDERSMMNTGMGNGRNFLKVDSMSKIIKSTLLITAVILGSIFIAMQFTESVNWSTFDFLVAAILLLGGGLIIDLIWRLIKNPTIKLAVAIGILLLVLLLWLELAVGVFGTPLSGS